MIDVKWKNIPSTGTQRGFKSQSYPKFCLCTVGCFVATLLSLTFNWEWSSGRVCFFFFFETVSRCTERIIPDKKFSAEILIKEEQKNVHQHLKANRDSRTEQTWQMFDISKIVDRRGTFAYTLSHKPCKNIRYESKVNATHGLSHGETKPDHLWDQVSLHLDSTLTGT